MMRPVPMLAILAAMARVAFAQVPAGPEFRVNTYTPDRQWTPAAAAMANGDFVVVWSNRTAGQFDVLGQRFGSDGVRLGAEFRASTVVAPSQFPRVGADAKGNFVVVWSRSGGVYGQRFDASGTPLGSQFLANSVSTGNPSDVAMAPGGQFVVAWLGGNSVDYAGAFIRRFGADGAPLGSEVLVNTYTTGLQQLPRVAVDATGDFVVAWYSSQGQDGDQYGVFAQRFDANGTRLGPNFLVNTYTSGNQWAARVASDPAGNFVIVWSDEGADGSGFGIAGQRFDSTGARLGSEFLVNTYVTSDQIPAEVAMSEDGAFVVMWNSAGQDGSLHGIFGQRFDPSAAPRGAEFRVNSYTTGEQYLGTIASDRAGNVLAAWMSMGQDGSDFGVYAQRYGGLLPTALRVDVGGNSILEPGETTSMRPTWRNVHGAAQVFGGTIIGVSGPPGGVPTFPVATADYGAVAHGTETECVSCYTVSVPDPTPRPAVHWDAVATEAITPEAQGQRKPWKLHVGRSFTDVPVTNVYYRYVETIVHHGITEGCRMGAVGAYCPDAPLTREQMAPLLLVAKEGSGYVPPACSGMVFKDITSSNPYCPWIEELARRGVVTGCTVAEYYCPLVPVTREEIAAFVLRTLDPTLSPPACVPPNVYNDVPETNPFCPWIEELANRGIVSDCGGGNYCPTAAVSREQVAFFVSETFGLTLYGP